VGLLYVRKGTPFWPLVIGGHQEEGNRGGTENVPYIVACGRAAELARAVSAQSRRDLATLRDFLEHEIFSKIPGTSRNGAREPRLPNTTSISFAGVDAEALLMMFDQLDICASSGSACTTGSVAPSHVLTAMQLNATEARSTIRFSLDYETKPEDVAFLMSHLPRLIAELRNAASPRAAARLTIAKPEPAAHAV
jgi:cysteine desulfurase